jgi:ATP-dependent helicase/nuclease subunit B
MSLPTPTSPILEALLAGDLIVTPSEAASRSLRRAFDAGQRQRGLQVWEPAHVLSWTQWLESLWSELIVTGSDTRLLLNEAQEHDLWRAVVSGAREGSEATLGSADSLADMAHQAWHLANEYGATSRLRAFASTHDARTFAGWAEIFARGCEQRGYLSRAALETTLRQHIETGNLAPPAHITLAGFGEWTPTQTELLDTMSSAGSIIVQQPLETPPQPDALRAVVPAEKEQDELLAIARWVRSFIEQRQAAGHTARVGILLPDVEKDRPALESVLREVLAPELQRIGEDLSSTPYEFAGGQPLSSLPMIAVVLDLARWIQWPLELSKVSALLLSPWVGALDGRNQSAQFDALALRQAKLLRQEIDLPGLLSLAQRSNHGAAPLTWLQPLNAFLKKNENRNTPRSFADWAGFLRGLAKAANWPGERPLTGNEFQATTAWDHLLDQLATLDFRGQRVPFATALHTLERLANATLFVPPSNDAPVQIMTPANALGLTFDALILARATDDNWPPVERTNPLLGWALQVSVAMPGTSQARATERAHQAMERLLASSSSVLFTYAKEDADGHQRLSPSIADLGWPQIEACDLNPPDTEQMPLQQELVEDLTPLPLLPSPKVRGGARVLQLQAACGFRAFAEMRLGASELESGTAGFDARESGSLLHGAMNRFWKEVRSQDALQAMPRETRQALLNLCIAESIDKDLRIQGSWDEAYVALQKERLQRLLLQWLDKELERGSFEVQHLEHDEFIGIGPLDLKLRIDRLDLVEDGVFLVDYKTGYSSDPKNWLGERPDEPQLPLYALLPDPGELKGLAFAKVRPGRDMKWLGFQDAEGMIPGTPAKTVLDMQQQVEEWRATLTTLAEDFANGAAAVQPKDYPTTCIHCAQRLLCRLDPTTLLVINEDAEEIDEDRTHG